MLIHGQARCPEKIGALRCILPAGHSRGDKPLVRPDEMGHLTRAGFIFATPIEANNAKESR